MQGAPPTQQPQAPSFDFGALANGIVNGIRDSLTDWTNQLPHQFATNGLDVVHQAISWANLSGLNFVARTPIELVTVGASIITPADVKPLLQDLTAAAFLLGAISYIGQYWFGWPGLGETVSRIATTVILVGSSFRVADLSLDMFNAIVTGVHGRGAPTLPEMGGINPVILFAAAVLWFVLVLRLALQMAKRIVWLATLYPLLPLASLTFLHGKSAWIGATIWKLWFGYLIGQLIVMLCFMVSFAMLSKIGGPGGFILSCAALMVAYEAVYLLAPKDSGVNISVPVGPAKFSL